MYEVLNFRDLSKPLRLLFATPQQLLRDPLWGRDPPVGNHWSNYFAIAQFEITFKQILKIEFFFSNGKTFLIGKMSMMFTMLHSFTGWIRYSDDRRFSWWTNLHPGIDCECSLYKNPHWFRRSCSDIKNNNRQFVIFTINAFSWIFFLLQKLFSATSKILP